jgi:hypothetical protein
MKNKTFDRPLVGDHTDRRSIHKERYGMTQFGYRRWIFIPSFFS